MTMHVIHPRCAALDLGKDVMVAAVRLQEERTTRRECRTYGTTTSQVLELSSWLTHGGITHVVMEATGSYWKSIWHLLEGQFELTLANPAQVKNLPGRKSDVKDATWMADLHAHGLIRGCFVPPPDIADLRDLTRTRKQFVREIGRHTLRIQKTLDMAGFKITGRISDLLGTSGRAIVTALMAGESDPERLADLVHPRVRTPRAQLVEALQGRLAPRQRRLLGMHLRQIEAAENSLSLLDWDIGQVVQPFRDVVDRLECVPGLSTISIPAMLAEIGLDMTAFPSHRHLLSWGRMCPRLNRSAGRVMSTRSLKGGNHLKTLMVQAAWCAVRTKSSYFQAQFYRLRARRGAKKAILAVAASLLTVVYYMLRDGTPYRDLGRNYFDHHDRARAARRLVARLHQLGYDAHLTEVA